MYSFEDIERKLNDGTFRGLSLEALNFVSKADALWNDDPDMLCLFVSFSGDGALPPLSRNQWRTILAVVLAAKERMDNPEKRQQPSLENPGGDVPEIPAAFREALKNLDLESL